MRDTGLVGDPGDAEVDDLHVPAIGADHHVRGLEVTVDESGGVRGRQAGADLAANRHDAASVEWPEVPARPLDQLILQRTAEDELHDEIGGLSLDAIVVGSDDVRMVQCGYGPGLAFESLRDLLAALRSGGVQCDQLDCHVATENLVVCPPHGAESALAEARTQLVTAAEQHPDRHGPP